MILSESDIAVNADGYPDLYGWQMYHLLTTAQDLSAAFAINASKLSQLQYFRSYRGEVCTVSVGLDGMEILVDDLRRYEIIKSR